PSAARRAGRRRALRAGSRIRARSWGPRARRRSPRHRGPWPRATAAGTAIAPRAPRRARRRRPRAATQRKMKDARATERGIATAISLLRHVLNVPVERAANSVRSLSPFWKRVGVRGLPPVLSGPNALTHSLMFQKRVALSQRRADDCGDCDIFAHSQRIVSPPRSSRFQQHAGAAPKSGQAARSSPIYLIAVPGRAERIAKTVTFAVGAELH